MDLILEQKRDKLITYLQALAKAHGMVAVAYSGGIDSRVLAAACMQAQIPVRLLFVQMPQVSSDEQVQAMSYAQAQGWSVEIIKVSMNLSELAQAGRERCYRCKTVLMGTLLKAASPAVLLEGSHADDAKGYRPGMRALQALGVLSPFCVVGMHKAEIRALARHWQLPNPDQQARPCLLTRFDYGVETNEMELTWLAQAETKIQSVFEVMEQDQRAFRLRKVDGQWQLHIAKSAQPLTESIKVALQATVADRICALPVLEMETLSGFFDAREAAQ